MNCVGRDGFLQRDKLFLTIWSWEKSTSWVWCLAKPEFFCTGLQIFSNFYCLSQIKYGMNTIKYKMLNSIYSKHPILAHKRKTPTLLKYWDPQRENTCSRNKACYRISFKNLSMDVKFYLSKLYKIWCIYLYHTSPWSQFSLLSLLWWDDRLVNPSDSSCLIMTDQMILNCIILQMGGICGQQTINICNICGQPGQQLQTFSEQTTPHFSSNMKLRSCS